MLTQLINGNSRMKAEKSASRARGWQVGLGEESIVAMPWMHSWITLSSSSIS